MAYSASQLVGMGYTGYQGWGDAGANADFNATGGAGKGSPNGGSSGGSGQISAPDLANLRKQVAGIIGGNPTADNPHPYYYELAAKANGNFDQAIKIMQGDYTSGVKKAKEDYALQQSTGQGDLQNSMAQLGLTFKGENNNQDDSLNKRGMATYQNNPDGTPNVVTGASFTPTYNTNDFSFSSGVGGTPSNQANLGQGGTEADLLRSSQALRAEATARAGMKPLQQAGLTLKQTTNPGTFDPNKPLASVGDAANMGSLERNLQSGYQTQFTNLTDTAAAQKAQQNTDINSIANTYGTTQQKAIDANSQKSIQDQYNTSFV